MKHVTKNKDTLGEIKGEIKITSENLIDRVIRVAQVSAD